MLGVVSMGAKAAGDAAYDAAQVEGLDVRACNAARKAAQNRYPRTKAAQDELAKAVAAVLSSYTFKQVLKDEKAEPHINIRMVCP